MADDGRPTADRFAAVGPVETVETTVTGARTEQKSDMMLVALAIMRDLP